MEQVAQLWQRDRATHLQYNNLSIEIECLNTKKFLFEPPFRCLRVTYIRTPSITRITRWKARGRLPIRHNWTFFRGLLRLRRYKRWYLSLHFCTYSTHRLTFYFINLKYSCTQMTPKFSKVDDCWLHFPTVEQTSHFHRTYHCQTVTSLAF